MAVMVGRLMAKILTMTIQLNLVPKPWRSHHKFTLIVIIKTFAINLPSQSFLGCHLGFHIFFHTGFFRSCTLFSQLGCFCIDIVCLQKADLLVQGKLM